MRHLKADFVGLLLQCRASRINFFFKGSGNPERKLFQIARPPLFRFTVVKNIKTNALENIMSSFGDINKN